MSADTGESTGATPLSDERLAMLAALVSGDVALAYRLATELLAHGVGFDDIVGDVFGPVQVELGARWAAGDIVVADEHAASAAVEDLIVRLGETVEAPTGPPVVVATAERDTHGLGARVVASALSLDGFRVLFLGASVPAEDLGEYLDLHQPLALALSCSIAAALSGAARCVTAAHDAGVPVVAGGRALTPSRARTLGADAFAGTPQDAVDRLRMWELDAPEPLATVPAVAPEQRLLEARRHRLLATALEALPNDHAATSPVGDELTRLLHVVDGALLLDEPQLVAEQVGWLRATGPAHGIASATLEDALHALARELDDDLQRAGAVLRAALA
jgi:methanogenic corrinoid protein MtbC1